MAIGYGSDYGSWGGSSSNPIQLSVTVASGTKLLVVYIINSSTTGRTGGAPYWKSAPNVFTQVGTNQTGGTEFNVELWYLIAPATGSGTLTIPNSGALTLYFNWTQFTSTSNITLAVNASVSLADC